ncbi:MAG TPA: ABC transporter permease [Caldilineaceae bacterium]|nr:ABC transporter permease [Caldilineaceae bacterium]
MIPYLLSRIFRWSTGLLLVAFVSYAMMFYGAGDPIKRMFMDMEQGGVELDEQALAALRTKFGLDRSFPEQFAGYLGNLVQGDWGMSIRERRPVWDMIKARLPISMQIGLVATLLSVLIGIPAGIFAALNHNRWVDQAIVGSGVFINAIPIFVTAPILLLFLVVGLGIMNVPFGWKGLFHTQVILPMIILALGPLPTIIRQTRAALLEVMSQDYIRTARAKGLTRRLIISRHMLRLVLIPVATSVGLILISLVNGALFIELIFSIPGFGKLTIQGVQQVDYPVIMATVIIGALIVMVGNMLIDLVYPLLDPRITRS